MNINSINIISRNSNNLYVDSNINNKVQSLNFLGRSSDIIKSKDITADKLSLSKKINNSKELLKLIKQHKFKDAYNFLNTINNEFDPMYQSGCEKPLLFQIASVKTKPLTRQDEYKIFIERTIISHEKFDIDKKFKQKSRLGNEYETTYLDEILRTNNVNLLLTMMDVYDGSIKDPNNDFFDTLIDKAMVNKQYELEVLFKMLALHQANNTDDSDDDVKTNVVDEKNDGTVALDGEQNDDTDDQVSSELLNKTKVYIPEIVPSSLDEVGGLSKVKKDIEDYIIKPWRKDIRKKLLKDKISLPNGFLMYGPTGSGKTFITNVIAKQTGYPLYSVNISNVGSRYLGDTSINLDMIFSALEEQYRKTGVPSILFFDELDDMGGAREESNSVGKREDLNTLLVLLNNASERGIIVIGATNYIGIVDKALMRSGRFDKKIEIALPTRDERKDILTKLLQNKSTTGELLQNVDLLADLTEGKSPADLAKYVNNCARQAIYDGKELITLEEFKKEMNEPDPSDRKFKIGF